MKQDEMKKYELADDELEAVAGGAAKEMHICDFCGKGFGSVAELWAHQDVCAEKPRM